jgi:hypothetical protein
MVMVGLIGSPWLLTCTVILLRRRRRGLHPKVDPWVDPREPGVRRIGGVRGR